MPSLVQAAVRPPFSGAADSSSSRRQLLCSPFGALVCSRSRALEAGHWLREGDRDDEGAATRCAAVARCPHLETIRIGPLQQLVPPRVPPYSGVVSL